ncbi:alanine racemase [Sandaracinobacteroides hominis]|uniref:alanine racemase n=1 Tax=Sandaracinobacteroides hominis TaxID=2780086 RepID=UPI0018F72792|nr:alanine racemase [Sandaracinobacteroides hominis]
MEPLTRFLAAIVVPRTPALVVRRQALLANLGKMQAACDAAGIRLRPHGKMAKCSRLALLQIELGAVGICCQTVGEAEAYARAGIGNLLVSAPVPPWGWPLLKELAGQGRQVSAVADSAAQIAAARAAGAHAVQLLVDVDGGQHRTGTAFANAPLLVREILAAGFSWGGIQCYLGHLQADPHRAEAHAAAMVRVASLVSALRSEGLTPAVVTGGGTGTAPLDLASGVFTELQAGSYAFMDVQYEMAGAAFDPALFCAASVVSAQRKGLVTLNAGLKALASDGPAPRAVASDYRFRFMGDEHGALMEASLVARIGQEGWAAIDAVDADADHPRPDFPAEGATVWLQPGHIDPTINLYDSLWVADEDGSLEMWAVDARRTTT